MIDEAEEEALFARLRERLRARGSPAAGAGAPAGPVLGLATGLDRLARRLDAVEAGLDQRIEQAVAREISALKMSVSRLEERVAALAAPPPRGSPIRAVLIGCLLLAIGAGAGLAAYFGLLPTGLWRSAQNEAARLAAGLGMLLGR